MAKVTLTEYAKSLNERINHHGRKWAEAQYRLIGVLAEIADSNLFTARSTTAYDFGVALHFTVEKTRRKYRLRYRNGQAVLEREDEKTLLELSPETSALIIRQYLLEEK